MFRLIHVKFTIFKNMQVVKMFFRKVFLLCNRMILIKTLYEENLFNLAPHLFCLVCNVFCQNVAVSVSLMCFGRLMRRSQLGISR